MPSKEAFRKAALARWPELAGHLRLNKLVHDGRDYSVTVRNTGTLYWIGVDDDLEGSVNALLAELGNSDADR